MPMLTDVDVVSHQPSLKASHVRHLEASNVLNALVAILSAQKLYALRCVHKSIKEKFD